MKKPWPDDAIMVECARKGEELRHKMESVIYGECRCCGKEIAADSFSVSEAQTLRDIHRLPIKFFCVQCALDYDKGTLTALLDHSKGRPQLTMEQFERIRPALRDLFVTISKAQGELVCAFSGVGNPARPDLLNLDEIKTCLDSSLSDYSRIISMLGR